MNFNKNMVADHASLSTNIDREFEYMNNLLIGQFKKYLSKQNSDSCSFQDINFSQAYKLLKLFNARMMQLNLSHGSFFELPLEGYKHDFSLLLNNENINLDAMCDPSLNKKKIQNENLFYREGEFLYRTMNVDRFAVSDFLDLVQENIIAITPYLVPLNALKNLFVVGQSDQLLKNPDLENMQPYPYNKNQSEIDQYQYWGRFNIGKLAFVMPYPKHIDIDNSYFADAHFPSGCSKNLRHQDVLNKVSADWGCLKEYNEITFCRVIVDLMSDKLSKILAKALKGDKLAYAQIEDFLKERKSRFEKLKLPEFMQTEYYEWGDLNANLRWLLSSFKKIETLDHEKKLKIINIIENPQIPVSAFFEEMRTIVTNHIEV